MKGGLVLPWDALLGVLTAHQVTTRHTHTPGTDSGCLVGILHQQQWQWLPSHRTPLNGSGGGAAPPPKCCREPHTPNTCTDAGKTKMEPSPLPL